MKRLLASALAAVALAACGTDKQAEPKAPQPASEPSAAGVIRAWAARYFAVPSLVSNGTPPITLRSRADVRLFNESLPCGAVLERTYRQGRYTAAVFRLTERPGRGRCGTGTGDHARTAFIIRGGKIRQWRRLANPQAPPAPIV